MSKATKVLVACALKKEAEGLKERIQTEYRSVTTGLGSDRTMRRLEKTFEQDRPDAVIFTGMAGQLQPELNLGEFVFPSSWQYESGTRFDTDPEWIEFLRSRGWKIEGVGITVRRPVVSEKTRLRLHQKTGGLICDMECAAAMMVASSYSVPCVCPKLISDTPDSGMLAFYRYFDRHIELLAEELESLIRDVEEGVIALQKQEE